MTHLNDRFVRFAVFIDGTYFAHVSNYYLYTHERGARLSVEGLHQFIRHQVAREETVSPHKCQQVSSHYFRGRLQARQTLENADEALSVEKTLLYRERQFEDALIREGVALHYLPMAGSTSELAEEGLDVWYALEAYEIASTKQLDVAVLLTGDGDFVPLVRKLKGLGTRVMLLSWDVEASNGRSTNTSQALLHEVNYPLRMHEVIDQSTEANKYVDRLFVRRHESASLEDSDQDIKQEQGTLALTPVAEEETTEGERTGTIAHINDCRTYGFVKEDGTDGTSNIFFHKESLLPGPGLIYELEKGSPVRFGTCQVMRKGELTQQVAWLRKC